MKTSFTILCAVALALISFLYISCTTGMGEMEYHPGKKIAIAAQETRLLVVVPKSDKEYWKDAAKRKTPMGFKGLVLVEANWIADEGELSKFIFLLAPADEISNTGTIKKDKVEKIRIGANFV